MTFRQGILAFAAPVLSLAIVGCQPPLEEKKEGGAAAPAPVEPSTPAPTPAPAPSEAKPTEPTPAPTPAETPAPTPAPAPAPTEAPKS